MWAEDANVNGLLGFLLSGTGTSTNAPAEAGRYGIVRYQTPASSTYTSWTMRMPLIWANIDWFEIGFRGWPINANTNTNLSVGMYDARSTITANGISVIYSTNQLPTNVWNMRVNNVTVSTFAFTAPFDAQLVNTWLKIRITNTNDTGSWSATFTNQATGATQTITGTGINPALQYFVGGIVTTTDNVIKMCDMDYCELQLK